jgi:hypothetical protein
MSNTIPDTERAPGPPAKVRWLHTTAARILYDLMYLASAFALARVIRGGRMISGSSEARGTPEDGLALLIGAGVGLVLSVGILALFTYEDLRWKGRLARKNWLFERFLNRG